MFIAELRLRYLFLFIDIDNMRKRILKAVARAHSTVPARIVVSVRQFTAKDVSGDSVRFNITLSGSLHGEKAACKMIFSL